MMLNISSCAYWPFLYPLRINICSSLSCIFSLGYWSFCCWLARVLYKFWALDLYQIHDLQIFFWFCRLSFSWCVFGCTGFLFWWSPIYLFPLLLFLFFGGLSKNTLPNPVSWRFTHMFPSKNSMVLAVNI